jgi:glycosyltransferase involved in cell wall biosynthesis
VLGSRIGGIPEYVEDGRTGRLLPPGDTNAWSEEIARVVSDRQQITTWSAGCLEAAERYNPGSALDAYNSLLQAIVTDHKARLSTGPQFT